MFLLFIAMVVTTRTFALPLSGDFSEACVHALANGLASQMSKCVDEACRNNMTIPAAWDPLVVSVLKGSSCTPKAAGQMNSTVKWLQYPGWHNGLVFDWLRADSEYSEYLLPFKVTPPTRLPPPSIINTAVLMHEETDRGTADYAVVTGDYSGASLEAFMSAQGYQSGDAKGLGFNHLPENACASEAEPRGPLHPRTFLLLFYRPDILSALHTAGIAASPNPPSSWDGLLALLQAHARARRLLTHVATGTGVSSGSGGLPMPRYGMCLTTSVACGRLGDILNAVAASVVQSAGTHQGYAFDLKQPPPAAAPLVRSSGWRYAAGVLRKLLAYNAPDDADDGGSAAASDACTGVSPHFLAGDCMLTMEWDAALPYIMSAAAQVLTRNGALGVAPLPGSTVVQNRSCQSDDELVNCTRELCAVSANHDLMYLHASESGFGTASLASAAAAAAATAPVASASQGSVDVLLTFAAREAAAAAMLGYSAATEPLVNRAPYSSTYGATSNVKYLGFDHSVIPNIALMAESMEDNIGRFRRLRQNFTDGMRRSLGYTVRIAGDAQNCSGYASTLWWEALTLSKGLPPDVRPLAAAAGLADAAAADTYLLSLWHALHSPNAAPDVASPVPVNWYKYAASYAALELLPAFTSAGSNVSGDAAAAEQDPAADASAVDSAISLLSQLYEQAVEAFGSGSVRESYSMSISAPPWHAPRQAPNIVSHGLSGGQLAAIVASVTVGLCAVTAAILLLILHRHRRKRNRDLLGRVMAPRVGSDTTLLVTDVQNSTVLWDQLPVEVMDVTLKLHHSTVRHLLLKYDGYESATEGDSFIVAFPNPTSALGFANAAQVELMLQEWPQQLLCHPDAAPVVVLADPRITMHGSLGFSPGSARSGLGGLSSRNLQGAVSNRQLQGAVTPRRRSSISGYHQQQLSSSNKDGLNSAVGAGAAAGMIGLQLSNSTKNLTQNGNVSSISTGTNQDTNNTVGIQGSGGNGWSTPVNIEGAGTGAATAAASPFEGSTHQSPPMSFDGYGTAVAIGSVGGVKSAAGMAGDASSIHLQLAEAMLGRRRDAHMIDTRMSLDEGRASQTGYMASSTYGRGVSGGNHGNANGGGGSEGGVDIGGAGGGHGWGLPPRTSCLWVEMVAAAFPVWAPADTAEMLEVAGEEWLMRRNGLCARLSDGRLGQMAFRGLRVRMGLHTGLDDPQHVVFNKVGSAYKYYGPFAEIAKLVSDAAPGGMITLSSYCFTRLRNAAQPKDRGGTARTAAVDAAAAVVLYGGHHILANPPAVKPRSAIATQKSPAASGSYLAIQLGTGAIGDGRSSAGSDGRAAATTAAMAADIADGGRLSNVSIFRRTSNGGRLPAVARPPAADPAAVAAASTFSPTQPHSVFIAVPPALLCRLALVAPLRSVQQTQVGTPEAPLGLVSIAFMKVVGASTLLAEIPGPAKRALEQFQGLACRLLGACGGYLVEGGDGLVLAAFSYPSTAVDWALDCLEGLQRLTWDEELLDHELCAEELVTRGGTAGGGLSPMEMPAHRTKTILHGGLRVKVGLDVGHATHTLTEASGRLSYRGKVMNRAARVAAIAAASQVLCTGAVWNACEALDDFCDRVVGCCLGRMNLKGIAQPVEVVQCSRERA